MAQQIGVLNVLTEDLYSVLRTYTGLTTACSSGSGDRILFSESLERLHICGTKKFT